MAAGDFTASQLQEINLKAEIMWTDSMLAASLKPEAEAARAVLERQTVKFKEFDDWDTKERKVKVTFIDACAIEAAADGLAVIAPALAPAGDEMAVGNDAMNENGGEALALAFMAEGCGADTFGKALHTGAGPGHIIARRGAGTEQRAVAVLQP